MLQDCGLFHVKTFRIKTHFQDHSLSMYQYQFLLSEQYFIAWMDQTSVYLFSSGWTSALFLLWGYYNAAMNVAILFWFLIIAVFSGIYLGVRFLGQMVDSTFKLLRKCQLFSTLTRDHFTFPPSIYVEFNFSKSLWMLLFSFKTAKKFGCEEISRHDFNYVHGMSNDAIPFFKRNYRSFGDIFLSILPF